MNGVLVVDKPAGPTSHDVVARVRRALRTRRIGHTGTLDPLATGVLPLVIGSATRLASLLSGGEKEYIAGIRLGLATETYDAVNRQAAPPAPSSVTIDHIESALDRFRGAFDQVPPPYSAKKIDGVRAYELARRRTPVLPSPVRVTVHQLTLDRYVDGLAAIRVRTSAGFYVRSLAHDLGQTLECGGHLETLRRVRAGAFTDDESVALSRIEEEGVGASRWLLPIEQLLTDIPAVVLSDRDRERATHGADVSGDDSPRPAVGGNATRRRLLDASGRLIAVAEVRPGGLLHPVIVLV